MTTVVGPTADSLVERGWDLTVVRKTCQGVALLGPAACMAALAALTPAGALPPGEVATTLPAPVGVYVGILAVAFALGAWSRGGLYSNHQDLSPEYASVLLGVSNTAGALPGVIGVWSAGLLLDATGGDWATAMFLPIVFFQLLGAAVFTVWGSARPLPKAADAVSGRS